MSRPATAALRVCSWNVLADAYLRPQYYPHLPVLPGPGERRGAVAGVAAALVSRVDVFCAQEVDEATAASIAAALGPGFESLFACRPGSRVEGSFIAARGALEPSFSSGSAGVADHRWVATRLAGPAGPVQVVGTHLPWAPAGAVPHVGVTAASQMLGDLDFDAVLVGDLNASSGSEVLAELSTAGFSGPVPPAATAVVNGSERAAIDWVLARGAARVERLEVPFAADRPLPDAAFPSDHVPVLADVSMARS